MIEFLSQSRIGERFMGETPDDQTVEQEPMFMQMPVQQAYEQGGEITRRFLDSLFVSEVEREKSSAFLNSRVHMLMPGWYPCIPGWHHDDVERSRADKQPNYFTASYRPHFALGIVGSAVCPTQIVHGNFKMDEVHGGAIYKEWHDRIAYLAGRYPTQHPKLMVPYGYAVWMDDRTLHQGTMCTQGGWRWFGRVTFGNPTPPMAKVRRQVNVYLENPMEGW